MLSIIARISARHRGALRVSWRGTSQLVDGIIAGLCVPAEAGHVGMGETLSARLSAPNGVAKARLRINGLRLLWGLLGPCMYFSYVAKSLRYRARPSSSQPLREPSDGMI